MGTGGSESDRQSKGDVTPDMWTDSRQAAGLLARQKEVWPLVANNFEALKEVKQKSFDMGGFTLRVQYNPLRLASSAAKTDAASIQNRQCFLCAGNLPQQQLRLPFGGEYLVLCNPYPIFPHHFTLPSVCHTAQSIQDRFADLLEMSRRLDAYTLFYNGPKCGASLPDHAHFQAVTRAVMPLDDEVEAYVSASTLLCAEKEGGIYLLSGYLRNGFVIQAHTAQVALSLFNKVYQALEVKPGETEPMMNLFSSYKNGAWTITIVPRRKHRPRQYDADGQGRIVSSPGAADIGGLFITPREEDFLKMTPELLIDIYNQVCLGDAEVVAIGLRLAGGGK